MKTKTLIVIFLFAIIFVMAKTTTPSGQKRNRKVKNDTIALKDSIKKDITPTRPAIDTTKMDSLQLAIYHHNKAIDDSIRLDSINRAKKNGIDAPVSYKGNDSLVYDAKAKRAYIYGEANVKYENMDLTSDRIALSTPWVPPIRSRRAAYATSRYSRWATPNTRAIPWPSTSRPRRALSIM